MENSFRFMTQVEIPAGLRGMIQHGRPLLTLGSCFANETGQRMLRDGFDVSVNPFGQLYNPLSILAALRRAADATPVTPGELVENQGLWHSFLFHTRFSRADASAAAGEMNRAIDSLHRRMTGLDTAILTLGSARCFILREDGNVVANCHKLPQSAFTVRDLSVDEVADTIVESFSLLRSMSPAMRMIVTVSPIRHKAYGYHADKLSKATLLLGADRAISRICASEPGAAVYFPSYEILGDELRDYRFYAADMIHPSDVAADYIYSRFADTFFSSDTIAQARRCAAQAARLAHRQIHSES